MMGNMLAQENGDGVIGIAKGLAASDVYVWRVFIDFQTYDPWVVYGGLSTAIDQGYKVVLYDFAHGEYLDQTEANLVSALWNSGGIMVSRGADDQGNLALTYPASLANVVAVSGVRDDGQFAADPISNCDGNSSSFGPWVDIAGPFWSYTTFTSSQGQQSIIDTRNSWLHFCTTQMSAAHVAGVIALIQARNPSWTPARVVGALLMTASNHASPNQYIGYGVPNADAALDYQPPPLSVSIQGPARVKPNVYCTWSSSVAGGTPPYTYYWTRGGVGVGTESTVNVYTGTSSFVLRLDAGDQLGSQGFAQKSVTVTSSAPMCPQ